MARFSFTLLVLLFVHFNISAQVTVVKDVNTNPGGLIPDYYGGTRFCKCGNYLYFNFENGDQTELWRTDGTETGTLKVLDQQGAFGSSESLCHNNVLYFSGNDGNTGFELWATDGTSQGTRLIKDLAKGSDNSFISNFVFYKGKIYFTTSTNDFILWQTEGSANSTIALQSFPTEYSNLTLTASDRYLYIDYYNSSNSSYQLMRSEGNEPSNTPITTNANFVTSRMVIGNYFFYSNYTSDYQSELWVNDEINNTITKLTDSYNIGSFHNYNNKLIFSSNQSTWTSDGTKNGTLFMSTFAFSHGVLHEGLLYGHSTIGNNYALVKTDGTTVSFVLDLKVPLTDFLSNPPAILNDQFILSISTSETGAEPALTDFTPNGTHVLKDVKPGIEGSLAEGWTTFNNKVFFLANDATHGREVWMTDGTEAGTKLLKDVAYGTADGVDNTSLMLFKDYIYFTGKPDAEDGQLLKAKENNPVQLIDTFKYRPTLIGRSNDFIYFYWNGKLIKSDGEHPSSIVRDFNGQITGSGWAIDMGFTLGNKFIYGFSTYSGPISLGNEFWVTDGTESGTHVLKDINPGAAGGADYYCGAVLSQHLIFSGNNGTTGMELWTSDGTESGTTLLKDINAGANQSQPYAHTTLGALVLFIANDGTHGNELWRTDGTPAGTLLVKDIHPGSNGSDVVQMTLLEKYLFFWAKDDDAHGLGLWKTDGTETGTVLVKGISPAGISGRYLAATSTRLFLTADDGTHGNELWVSNGTAEGTMLIDVSPGGTASNPLLLGTGDDFVFFASNQKLWISDGTAINTFVIADIKTEKVIYQNGWLYFLATTPDYGYEVYKLQLIKKDQTITFSIPEKVYGENPFELTATSTSGMPVSFTSQSGKISIQNNSTVSLLQSGSVTVKASQPGNALYNPAEASVLFCINPAKPQITEEDLITSVKLSSSSTEGNEWFADGERLSATTPTFTVTQSGVYAVQVTVDNCKSEMSDDQNVKIKETIIGLDEAREGFSLSPNPASTQLHIQSLTASRTQIEIYSANGKLLDRFYLEGNSSTDYSLHNYPSGLYFTKLNAGDRVHVNKFIKE